MKENNKSLTINSIFYLLYNIINVIFPFLTGIYVTHILLPDTIGQVEIARNLAQYFIIFSFLGIPTYGLREISKYRKEKDKLNKIYSELMIINFISTCIFLLLYIILIIVVTSYRENIHLFLIAGIPIALNIFNNSWLFEGLEEFKYISYRNMFFKIMSFALLVIFVKSSDDYLIYAFITVFGTAGNYLLNMINSKKFVTFSCKQINLKRHMKSIFFLVVVNLAIEIYTLVDITMLGLMSEEKTVAFYTYGSKTYKVFLQIINTFTMVLVPKIALYYKENNIEEYNKVLTKTLKVILILSIPMIVGTFYTSDYLITIIYGFNYIKSSYVLKILSIILLISPVGYLLGSRILLVTNNEKKMVIPVSVGASVNIILNYILIPKLYETGAAIASVSSEIIVMIIYISLGSKYYKLNNMKQLIICESIAVTLMTCYLHIVSILILDKSVITILQILGGIFIYFGTLIILKEEFTYSFINKLKIKFIYKFMREEDLNE